MQTDSSYWKNLTPVGIDGHYYTRNKAANNLKPAIQGRILSRGSYPAREASLYDHQGRALKLVRLGAGNWRIESPMRAGVYFLKAGASGVVKLNYLP